MAQPIKNVFSDPDMVYTDKGLYEYVTMGSMILADIASKLEAAQMNLYRGLQSAGKRETTCKLVSFPLGQAADSCMDAKRQLERTWRVAKVMIRGLGAAQRATSRVKAFTVGGQAVTPDE